jgi:hypothetical protein
MISDKTMSYDAPRFEVTERNVTTHDMKCNASVLMQSCTLPQKNPLGPVQTTAIARTLQVAPIRARRVETRGYLFDPSSLSNSGEYSEAAMVEKVTVRHSTSIALLQSFDMLLITCIVTCGQPFGSFQCSPGCLCCFTAIVTHLYLWLRNYPSHRI